MDVTCSVAWLGSGYCSTIPAHSMTTGLVIVALVSWRQAAVVGTVVAHGDITTVAGFRLLYADIATFVFVVRLTNFERSCTALVYYDNREKEDEEYCLESLHSLKEDQIGLVE